VIARGEVVADKGRFGLRIVHLVGEDGQELPSASEAEAPAEAPAADVAASAADAG
jgi:flagellar motor switch protein FliN/FliY